MRNALRLTLLIALLIGPLVSGLFAQPGPPGPPDCWPPPCIPIDGGISALIAMGLALGGKKAYDLRKNHKTAP